MSELSAESGYTPQVERTVRETGIRYPDGRVVTGANISDSPDRVGGRVSTADLLMQPVRCYSCGHQYAAIPNRIDTACPACGSDSFLRVNPDERCREDYVHVGQDAGGSVYTFCETCPRRNRLAETGGQDDA